MTNPELEAFLIEKIKSSDKTINFISSTLRSASTIWKKGGHVTMVHADRSFTLHYDNKRQLVADAGSTLLDSVPLKNVESGRILREISRYSSKSNYQQSLPPSGLRKTYKNNLELGIRNFLKALFRSELNLDSSYFKSYKEIILFIHGYKCETKYKLTPNQLAALKRRSGSRVLLSKTPELDSFVSYVKETFPCFDENEFYK